MVWIIDYNEDILFLVIQFWTFSCSLFGLLQIFPFSHVDIVDILRKCCRKLVNSTNERASQRLKAGFLQKTHYIQWILSSQTNKNSW